MRLIIHNQRLVYLFFLTAFCCCCTTIIHPIAGLSLSWNNPTRAASRYRFIAKETLPQHIDFSTAAARGRADATSIIPTSPIITTTTRLYSSSNNNNDRDDMEDVDNDDPLGLSRGGILFLIVFLFNVWLFSIPTEFRRARSCTEEQVRLYPDSNCMTNQMWVEGITNYYKNGGGVQFDFSIEGKE